MDNQDQTIAEEVQVATPVDETVESQPDSSLKKASKKALTDFQEQEEVWTEDAVAEGEDRSAFNCPDCLGEGLKSQTELCSTCGGTGKI